MAERARRGNSAGFGLWLVPLRRDPKLHCIEFVGRLGRGSVSRTLRTFGVAPVLSDASSESPLARKMPGTRGAAARIEVVRLSPRQALEIFDRIRGTDASVRELYAHLRRRDFVPVGGRARGTVMRAYSADDVPGTGGAVLEMFHEGPDGTLARFGVSVREVAADARGRALGAVSVTCSIGRLAASGVRSR